MWKRKMAGGLGMLLAMGVLTFGSAEQSAADIFRTPRLEPENPTPDVVIRPMLHVAAPYGHYPTVWRPFAAPIVPHMPIPLAAGKTPETAQPASQQLPMPKKLNPK